MLWNFIKSETYRATRFKAFYILPAILLCSTFIVGLFFMRMDFLSIMGYSEQDFEEINELGASYEGLERSFNMGLDAGMNMSRDVAEGETEEPEDFKLFDKGLFYYEDVPEIFRQNMGELDQMIFIAIFAGLFIGDIFSSGCDKNLLIATNHRGKLLLARFIVFDIYVFILHVLRLFFVALSIQCLGESVKWNIDRSFILYFLVTYLICVAFGNLMCAFGFATRSKAATIAVGVILSSGMLTIAITLVNQLINRGLGVDFNLADYLLTQNLAVIDLVSDGKDVLRAIIVSLVYFIASCLGSLFIVRKRDVS